MVSGWCLVGVGLWGVVELGSQLVLAGLEGEGGAFPGRVAVSPSGDTAGPERLCEDDVRRGLEWRVAKLLGDGVWRTSAEISLQLRARKHVLQRLTNATAPGCVFTGVDGDIADADVAEQLLACEFLFLATDTITSRLVFNSIIHRYLIPGIQIGAKVDLEPDGSIGHVYVAVRPVMPTPGCLQCNSLNDPVRLQIENQTDEERAAQNYVGEPEIIDPSVITLNGVAASHASTVMLFALTGLAERSLLHHRLFFTTGSEVFPVLPQMMSDCVFCGTGPKSMYARGGPVTNLPVRHRAVTAMNVEPEKRRNSRLRNVLKRFRLS